VEVDRTQATDHGAGRPSHSDEVADSGGGRGWALFAATLGFAVVQLDVSVVNVAIKPVGAEFGGDVSGLQWVVNAYTLAFAALILSAGALGDRVGAKRVFVSGFALFTLASAACGLAWTLPVLIGARAVQGVGAAALVPCSLTLLNHAYSETAARAKAVGLWAAGGSVALSAGPVIGGTLTQALGWRAIFFINAPIGILGIVLTLRCAAETPRSSDRGLDLAGQGAAMVALVGLAGGMFVLIETRAASPMLPLDLFSSHTFTAASVIGLLVNIAFYGLIFVFSLYFQTTQHYSALQTGLLFLPTTAAVLVANLRAGRLTAAWGTRRVLAGAALLLAVSLASLLFIGATTPYPALVAQLVVIGVALGLIVPAITSALLGSVDQSRSGVASGTLNTARQTGSVVGVALFGSLASGSLVTGLHLGLVISAALAIGILALAFTIDRDA
jgi:DHA2 family methylenomycin A resistance protein-like MFS transporter